MFPSDVPAEKTRVRAARGKRGFRPTQAVAGREKRVAGALEKERIAEKAHMYGVLERRLEKRQEQWFCPGYSTILGPRMDVKRRSLMARIRSKTLRPNTLRPWRETLNSFRDPGGR